MISSPKKSSTAEVPADGATVAAGIVAVSSVVAGIVVISSVVAGIVVSSAVVGGVVEETTVVARTVVVGLAVVADEVLDDVDMPLFGESEPHDARAMNDTTHATATTRDVGRLITSAAAS